MEIPHQTKEFTQSIKYVPSRDGAGDFRLQRLSSIGQSANIDVYVILPGNRLMVTDKKPIQQKINRTRQTPPTHQNFDQKKFLLQFFRFQYFTAHIWGSGTEKTQIQR